jgi:PAS domain S-box-containing protein
MKVRLGIAFLLPVLALALQWMLWPWLRPFVWFLFFPVVFFSASIVGFWGGILSTVLSAGMVWFFFLPPELSWRIQDPHVFHSVYLFVLMGVLFSVINERIRLVRVKVDSQLNESEKRFEATFDQAAVGIALVSLEGHWLRVNRKLCEIVGYTQEELLPLTFKDITYPEDLDKDLSLVNQVLAGEIQTYSLEKRYVRKDGELVWINLTVALERKVDGTPSNFISIVEEINTRKQAEAELARYKAIVESSDDAIISKTLQGIITSWNHGAEKLFGYSAAEAIGQSMQMLTPADRRNEEAQILERLAKGGRIEHFETVRCKKNGGLVQISTTISPIFDQGGQLVGAAKIARDITQSKQAEEEIRSAKTKLEAALASMSDAVFISDTAGRFIHFNDAFATFHRFTNKMECARKLSEYPDFLEVYSTDGELLPLEQWAVPRALRGESGSNVEYVLRRKDTNEMWDGSYTFAPIRNELGEIVGSVVTGRDVTEYKKAEAQLRIWGKSFEHAHFGLAISNALTNCILTVNPAFARERGYTPEEMIGMPIRALFPVDVFPDAMEKLLAVDRTSNGVLETEHICKDGRRFPVMLDVTVIRAPDGKKVNRVAYALDITEQRQAKEEIRQLNADLERRVCERTAELTSANQELDSFAYAVSHDLRGPLRALSGFSQALKEDFGDQLQNEAKIYLDQIDLASRKMGELIDGILVLSRITRGEVRHNDIDISAMSVRLLEEFARGEPERQLAWTVAPSIRAIGDERMIEAVLRNLLGNAWKYTGKTAAPHIQVSAVKEGGQDWIVVADNGAGFDMAHRDRLFKPFQRLHRQEEFPGLGIGLATVQRIIHRHGGVIRADGQPGAGAIFSFALPGLPLEKMA